MHIYRHLQLPALALMLMTAGTQLGATEQAAQDSIMRVVEIFHNEEPPAVVVGLENYPLTEPPQLVLQLDDVPFPELVELPFHKTGEATGSALVYRQFLLQRRVVSQKSWRELYERNERTILKTVAVEVSLAGAGGAVLPSRTSSTSVDLRMVSGPRFASGGAIILVLGFFFYRLLRQSRVIRSVSASTTADTLACELPYSLGRTQMAFWFFLVASSYLFIWAVTGQYNTISSSELVLLGISASTALGSVLISGQSDDVATADAAAEVARLRDELKTVNAAIATKSTEVAASVTVSAEQAKLTRELAVLHRKSLQISKALDFQLGKSRGFLIDLVSDDQGVTIHRFQILGWTVVLGMVYGSAVIGSLSLPEFDTVTLGLMGISSGTYLGFKFPAAKN